MTTSTNQASDNPSIKASCDLVLSMADELAVIDAALVLLADRQSFSVELGPPDAQDLRHGATRFCGRYFFIFQEHQEAVRAAESAVQRVERAVATNVPGVRCMLRSSAAGEVSMRLTTQADRADPLQEVRLDPLRGRVPNCDGVKYLVVDEHTLAARIPGSSFLQVLHGKLLKGGHDWKNGPIAIVPGFTRLRPATRADFESFRVMPPVEFDEQQEPGDSAAQYEAPRA